MAGVVYATLSQFAIWGVQAGMFAGVFDDGQITIALQGASDLASGYYADQFTLPLLEWGTDLSRAVCIIAGCDLADTRGHNVEGSEALFETRRRNAIEWLERVSKGEVAQPLVVDSSTDDDAESGGLVTTAPSRGYRTDGFTR